MKNLTASAGALALALAVQTAQAQEHDHSQMDHSQHPSDKPKDCLQNAPEIENITWEKCKRISPNASGSGTSRLPGIEGGHTGLHIDAGDDWMVMAHGYAWGVYTDQSGPRGDDKAYVQSMAMLSVPRRKPAGARCKAEVDGQPRTADEKSRLSQPVCQQAKLQGGEALVDRQHPHDLFMELAARVDINVGADSSVFLYGGPVGEPALGPSAFMHRGSARYNPEAPITHHWFDSGHITYGVATAGFASRQFQIEGSIFTGQEPDEDRWDIEKPRFDSWSVRATWNPAPSWAVQASTGRLKEPESLHPGEDEQRTTASVHYANGSRPVGDARRSAPRIANPVAR